MFIKSIIGGKGLMVNGGGSPSVPYVNSNGMENPAMGQIRLRNNDLEVWTGGGWNPIYGGSAIVELDYESKSILEWVKNKMEKEKKYKKLAETNEAVAHAMQAIEDAERELDFIVTLSTDHSAKDGI